MSGGVIGLKAIALPLFAGLAGCAMSSDAQPPAPPAAPAAGRLLTWPDLLGRPRPVPDHVIRYGRHERQVVDLYLPAGNGPHPVVVMIHGGCWSAPWDRNLMSWISDDLRRRGIAVWNIDYRVIENGSGYPHLFADTVAAADAVLTHAVQYRLDPERIAAAGHSAGGHLALWLAARRANAPAGALTPRVPIRAVISLGGLPDLELAEQPPGSGCGTEVIGQLIGRGQPGRGDPFADTSVPRIGRLRVPQVLINGDQDRIIPTHFAAHYARRMRALGDDVRVRMIDATGHVELVAPESAAWAAAAEEIERALGR